MRRWQLILELLLYYTPIADSLHLCFPLGWSGRLPLVVCRFFLPWSQFCREQDCPYDVRQSRSVYTFGSRFTYKRWVKVLSKIWILAFLGKYSNIICWVSKRVDWCSHHSNIVCWVSMRVYWGLHHLSNISWQFGPSSFVLGHFFLLDVDLGFDMKWVGVAKFFVPKIFLQIFFKELIKYKNDYQ